MDYKKLLNDVLYWKSESRIYEDCHDGSYGYTCSMCSEALNKLEDALKDKKWKLKTCIVYINWERNYKTNESEQIEKRTPSEYLNGEGLSTELRELLRVKNLEIEEIEVEENEKEN